MPKHIRLALALAAAVLTQPIGPAAAGGGDFVGGVIGGVILKTIIDNGVTGGRRQAAPPRHGTARQSAEVTQYWKSVQTALNEVGFDVGRVDGVAGRRTRDAVRQFQESIGEEPSGTLTGPQHGRLMALAGMDEGDPGQPGELEGWDTASDGGASDQAGYGKLVDENAAPATAADVVEPDKDSAPARVEPPADLAPPGDAQPPTAIARASKSTEPPAASTDGLAAFDAPALVDDAALEAALDGSVVLGVRIGDKRAAAQSALAEAFDDCTFDDTDIGRCSGTRPQYTDEVRFAAAGPEDDDAVYMVWRSIHFHQPVPVAALKDKLAETIGPLVEDTDHLITSSNRCNRMIEADGQAGILDAVAALAKKDSAALDGIAEFCLAAASVEITSTEAGATGVDVLLFDSRLRSPVSASASAVPDLQ